MKLEDDLEVHQFYWLQTLLIDALIRRQGELANAITSLYAAQFFCERNLVVLMIALQVQEHVKTLKLISRVTLNIIAKLPPCLQVLGEALHSDKKEFTQSNWLHSLITLRM